MKHPIYKVTAFKKIAPFVLEVKFDDQKKRQIDFTAVSATGIYARLQDQKFFDRVRIDPEVHTLVWPDGIDFDPASLHDWPQFVEHFALAAKQWRLGKARKNQRSPQP